MMKKIALILVSLSLSATAFAQSGDVKTKFYDFDDLLIDGEYKKPQVMYIDTTDQVKFERFQTEEGLSSKTSSDVTGFIFAIRIEPWWDCGVYLSRVTLQRWTWSDLIPSRECL